MSLIQKVTHGVLWLALAQVARRLSGLIITAVLARLLTPEVFGLVALAAMVVQLVAIFGEMGITSALVQRAHVTQSHLNSGFWLNMVAASGLALLGIALARPVAMLLHEPRIVPLLMVMMVVLPISAMGQVPDVLLQRALAFRQIALIDWIASLTAGVLGVGAALAGFGMWALVVQSVSLAIISTVGRITAARWKPSLSFQRESVRDLLSFSLSVLGCALVNYGVINVDNALIGGTLGVKALGYYLQAYALVMMPGTTVGSLVSRVMFPALSSMQNDLPRLRRSYLRMLRVVAAATFPLSVGLGATAPLLIPVIYGPLWAPSIPLLQIMTVWGLFQSINLSGTIFYATGRPTLLLCYAIVSLLVMTLSFAIGVRWGLQGVAWAGVAVSPLVGFGPHIIANRLIGLPTKAFAQAIGPPLIAALLMGLTVSACIFATPHSTLLPALLLSIYVGVGVLIYAGTLIAWGMISGNKTFGELKAWILGEHLSDAESSRASSLSLKKRPT